MRKTDLAKGTLFLIFFWIGGHAPVIAQRAQPAQRAQGTQETQRAQPEGTSFEELARMALTRNADLQAARESVHQAEARLTQARLWPNPSVELSKKTDAPFANEGDRGYGVTVSEPLELGGKRGKRTNLAKASIEVARADVAEAERQLTGRLRLLFFEAQGIAVRVDLLEQLDRANSQMAGVMNVRVRAGDASQLDFQLLQAQTNQVRAERLVTQNQLAGLVVQIRTIAGLSADEPLVVKAGQGAVEMTDTEEAAVARALQNRPDLKASRLREELAEAGISVARSQAIPDVTAFARYAQESLLGPSPGATQTRSFARENVLEFGVSVPLPIFNREQGNVSEAASRRVQARAERESLEAAVRRDVALAFHRYETARTSVEILRSGVLAPNEASVRMVQLSYNLGELRFLDIVNQQRVLIDAETMFASAQIELNTARAELETAIGSPPD
ncbi:MAG TPA: TolC family protein [Vicinamibacterales bacterium]|nr:TolC family protein [Vicinamibacterales bacterium]